MCRNRLGGLKFNKLVVRLKRKGCNGYPLYEIVLMKQKSRRDSIILEKLGFINPQFNARVFIINSQRLAFWLNRGVIVHNTVKKYISKFLVN